MCEWSRPRMQFPADKLVRYETISFSTTQAEDGSNEYLLGREAFGKAKVITVFVLRLKGRGPPTV